MLKRLGWQCHCDDESVHRYSVRIIDQCDVTIVAHISMTSQLLSCWHLKSYRERLGMNGMIFVYLRPRKDSIANEQWYFEMVNITRGWIHVPDGRFSKFRNRSGALNRLASDVIINWHEQGARRKISLIPSALSNVLLEMACCWIVDIAKILTNDGMEPEEITNIKIYRPKFILKWHVFVLHMTSVNTGSVQVTRRAVGARTMDGFGADLVRSPAIWLMESQD